MNQRYIIFCYTIFMSQQVLELQHVCKQFNDEQVLTNISLSIQKKSFVVILGASGSGKSTLLRLIAGLESLSSGNILIDTVNQASLTPQQRNVAMVFQDYALYPHMTAFDNIALTLKLAKKSYDKINNDVLKAAKLLAIDSLLQKYPSQLSGGQKQRVAIARTIVRNPTCFLFDEPLSNLDTQLRDALKVAIKRCHDQLNAYTLYVTHDQQEALSLADYIILLDKGRVIQMDTPEKMMSMPKNIFVATFLNAPYLNQLTCNLSYVEKEAKVSLNHTKISLSLDGHALQLTTCLIAFRHEHITTTVKKVPHSIPMNIDHIEFRGAAWQVKGTINHQCVTCYTAEHYAINTLIYLTIDPKHIWVFDAKTKNTIKGHNYEKI